MKQSAVYLVDWTPDFRFLIFRATGGWTAGTYVIVGPDSVTPGMLANIRDDIPREAVVPVSVIDYDARDGLNIPALLTIQDEVRGAGDAPLIVLPHGGPEAYDQYGFDWLAQYFASRGIAVLQPQFRGSTGFGNTLRQAGKGQWGGAMSTDLDDGVQHLIDEGLVDPERVCMVGLSYGGYAALAAGAFSPFDYKCVVSVSGVSDLPRMLDAERELYGRNSAVVNYLRTQFGSDGEADRTLKPISPVNFADDFKAPVLLIHGRDDAVVAIDQSLRMEKALKRARKPVELLRLKGEDHYLSGYETRIEALRAIAGFIDKNL
jgi:dipeptidyl aminopeptidase/acylaminoacyl peptidase